MNSSLILLKLSSNRHIPFEIIIAKNYELLSLLVWFCLGISKTEIVLHVIPVMLKRSIVTSYILIIFASYFDSRVGKEKTFCEERNHLVCTRSAYSSACEHGD